MKSLLQQYIFHIVKGLGLFPQGDVAQNKTKFVIFVSFQEYLIGGSVSGEFPALPITDLLFSSLEFSQCSKITLDGIFCFKKNYNYENCASGRPLSSHIILLLVKKRELLKSLS